MPWGGRAASRAATVPAGPLARWRRAVLPALLLATVASTFGGDLVLVTSRQAAPVTIAPRDVADILLGRKRSRPNGHRIKVALLKVDARQESFFGDCLARTSRQYWSHWRDLVFSGKGQMPRAFETEQELLAYVSAEDGAVGLLDSAFITATSGVQVVRQEGAPPP